MCGGVRKSSSITLTLVASVAVTTNVSRFVSHVCGYSITAALTVGLGPTYHDLRFGRDPLERSR